jgi:MYXO-CTERM domain-containing protein
MRKIIATSATAITLLLGGAGVAHATAPVAPAPTSTITTLADDNGTANNDDDHGDKTGLWGLAGLLGLIGLAGLKRRKDADHLPGDWHRTRQSERTSGLNQQI